MGFLSINMASLTLLGNKKIKKIVTFVTCPPFLADNARQGRHSATRHGRRGTTLHQTNTETSQILPAHHFEAGRAAASLILGHNPCITACSLILCNIFGTKMLESN